MNLYTIFHLNLMFSSVAEEQREEVIRRCYWPMLSLAENGLPLGVELPGLTAELIDGIDPEWTRALRRLIESGRVELVGSGYAQLIGPLVPAAINRANFRVGNDVYREKFGTIPSVALVNEMTWSSGLAGLYLDAGYKAVVMEWNNAARFHDWPDARRLSVCQVADEQGRALAMLWADSLLFQQLQRVVHGVTARDDYHAFFARCVPAEAEGVAAFYCNDAEAFGFRPGRFETEEVVGEAEWEMIAEVAGELRKAGYRFVLPSEALAAGGNRETVRLESPEQPVVVKKQRKYNANRWALSGRSNVEINSRCHRLSRAGDVGDREVCYLWSSDFRTHITAPRWSGFRDRLAAAEAGCKPTVVVEESPAAPPREDGGIFRIQDARAWVDLDPSNGLTVRGFGRAGESAAIGLVPHGTFSNIEYGADFYSGSAVIFRPGERLKASIDRFSGPSRTRVDGATVTTESDFPWARVRTQAELRGGDLVLRRRMELPARKRDIIRLFNFTFLPEAWDSQTLSYATHNGGCGMERFALAGHSVDHANPVSWLTSSEFCLGMTEGVFEVSDARKRLRFSLDPAGLWILPKVIYRELGGGEKFLRVEFSAQEIDETFVPDAAPAVLEAGLRIGFCETETV